MIPTSVQVKRNLKERVTTVKKLFITIVDNILSEMTFLCLAPKCLVVSRLTLKHIGINEGDQLSKLVCLLEDEKRPIGVFDSKKT